MKRWVLSGLMSAVAASGQMHKVDRPEQVVRAVGVYEWTGDLTKPKGMRLVPVTIFIDGQVQDAGVYLARPIPMALQSGTLYELDEAGMEKGLVDLMSARHVQVPEAADLPAFDDGWFGYGKFEPPAASKVSTRTSKPSSRASMNGKPLDDSKPHFGSRKTDDDKPEEGSPEDVKVNTGDDKDDVDRPTLRRRGAVDPKTAKKDKKAKEQSSVIAEKGSLNDDPDRPTMKRKGALTEDDFPALNGLPADMKQMVAVSDPKRREPHPFAREWEDDAEKQMVMGKMREIARAELLKYGPVPVQAVAPMVTAYTGPQVSANAAAAAASAAKAPVAMGPGLASQDTSNGAPVLRRNKVAADAAAQEQVKAPVVAAAPVAAPVVAAKASAPSAAALAKMTPVQRRAALAKAKKAAADAASAKAAPEVLVDEEVKGFTLSYGGAATYVYTAHTAGTGAALRYVTIVAQGSAVAGAKLELKVAMKGVTDAAHLDRNAWMRFVDVVDVEASNRASLLFELRGQSSRQFGVYRVIDGKADTVFMGGTTQ